MVQIKIFTTAKYTHTQYIYSLAIQLMSEWLKCYSKMSFIVTVIGFFMVFIFSFHKLKPKIRDTHANRFEMLRSHFSWYETRWRWFLQQMIKISVKKISSWEREHSEKNLNINKKKYSKSSKSQLENSIIWIIASSPVSLFFFSFGLLCVDAFKSVHHLLK